MNLPFKIENRNTLYQPEISNCRNKWCLDHGNVPASGNLPAVQGCGSFKQMEIERNKTGGYPTGRGVTPCNFGYLQKIPPNDEQIALLYPYSGKNFQELSQSSIFFDPTRPGFLPPQGNVRPLKRIGYEWRS